MESILVIDWDQTSILISVDYSEVMTAVPPFTGRKRFIVLPAMAGESVKKDNTL